MMNYISNYKSKLGDILLASDGEKLIGLWFSDQKYFASTLKENYEIKELPVFQETKRWLDLYFSSQIPDFTPPLKLIGTPFQQLVYSLLLEIPYGKTVTYGYLATIISKIKNVDHFSAQAVGNAISHNPISIIIPCHRVIGTNNTLTGYAGGLEKKEYLLNLEKSKVRRIANEKM